MASDCGDFAETFNAGEFRLTPPPQPGRYPILKPKKAANFMAFRGAGGKGRPARAGTTLGSKTGGRGTARSSWVAAAGRGCRGQPRRSRQLTSTLVNCQGSLVSRVSGNSSPRRSSGVQSV